MRRPSPAAERYLTALQRCGAAGAAVTTSRLAEALGVSLPSVSTMLTRLQALGFVVRVRAGAWDLTDAGREAAHRVGVHHRLIAAHLVEELGLPHGEAEREATRLEHHLSPALEARLRAAAGRGVGPDDGSAAAGAACPTAHRPGRPRRGSVPAPSPSREPHRFRRPVHG